METKNIRSEQSKKSPATNVSNEARKFGKAHPPSDQGKTGSLSSAKGATQRASTDRSGADVDDSRDGEQTRAEATRQGHKNE